MKTSSMSKARQSTKILSNNTILRENVHANNRKKTSSNVKSKKSRKSWEMEDKNTSMILEEMGISLIDDDSQDLCLGHGPTPPCSCDTENMHPLQGPHTFSFLNSSPGSSNSNTDSSCENLCNPESRSENFVIDSSPVDHIFGITRKRKSYTLTGEGMINKLSDEMVLAIFKWLPRFMLVRCASVCKRWHRLGMDESLWKRLDLGNKTLSAGVLGKVLDRGVSILRLAKAEISTPIHTLSQVINSVRPCQLQYLDLSMAVIKTEGLEKLLSRCNNLKKVSLESCQLTESVCHYLGLNRQLLALNLSSCRNLTVDGLSEIITNCTCLESLNVGWTYLDREIITLLVLCLPKSLLKLNLSGTREMLSDQDVRNLIRTCPHLKELDLSDATLLTSDILDDMVMNLKGLEHLSLSRCYQILPSSLPVLGSMVTLMALDVFGTMKEQTLQSVREAIPTIEINKYPFSSIARPTTGIHRTSIWGLRVRENVL